MTITGAATHLAKGLAQFTGSPQFYRHRPGGIIYTEGVKYLADNASAYWLLDIITSWQAQKRVRSEEFQVWKLTREVATDGELHGGATIVAEDGNDTRIADQRIEYTDFPLSKVTLFLENNTLMLPQER